MFTEQKFRKLMLENKILKLILRYVSYNDGLSDQEINDILRKAKEIAETSYLDENKNEEESK